MGKWYTKEEFCNLTEEEMVQYLQERLQCETFGGITGEDQKTNGNYFYAVVKVQETEKFRWIKPISGKDGEEIELFDMQDRKKDYSFRIQKKEELKSGDLVSAQFQIADKGVRDFREFPVFVTSVKKQNMTIDEFRIKQSDLWECSDRLEELQQKKEQLEVEFVERREQLAGMLLQQKEQLEEELKLRTEEIENNLKKQTEEMEVKIEEKKLAVDAICDEYKKENKKLEQIGQEIKEEEEKLQKIQDTFRSMGIHMLLENPEPGKYYSYSYNIAKKSQKIIENLAKKGFAYSAGIISRFLLGLHTKNIHQLIILSGPPGTGKTSLPRLVAEELGGVCKIISVQPNWTDNQDLLGFYNGVDHRYMSTPFLEALIEASENPDKPYLICLDEMNLAHVEYYFSEILSAMEDKKQILHLYGEYEHQLAFRHAYYTAMGYQEQEEALSEEDRDTWANEYINAQEKRTVPEFSKIQEQLLLWKRYPADFAIPENVRFIGTINMDDTTNDLSPKVIDRSYVIEIPDENDSAKRYQTEDKDFLSDTAQNWGKGEKHDDNLFHFMQTKMESIVKEIAELDSIQVRTSHRFYAQIKDIIRGYQLKENESEKYINHLLDGIMMSKLLPQLEGEAVSEDDFDKLKNIISSDYELCQDKLQRMYTRKNGILNYWI